MNLSEQLTLADRAVLFPAPNFDEYKELALEKLQNVFDEEAVHICLRLTGHGDLVDPPTLHAHTRDHEVLEIKCKVRFVNYLTKLASHYTPNFSAGHGGGIVIIMHVKEACFQLSLSSWYTTETQQFSYHNEQWLI